MPWLPKYDAKFAEPLLANLATVIAANEADALAWANGSAMTAFQPYRKALWVNTIWPQLSIVLQRSQVPESEDESRIEHMHSVVFEIEETGKDPDTIAGTVQKRVRAIAMIVLTATSAALLSGYTKAGSLTREIGDIDYRNFFRKEDSLYMRTATFTVTFTFMETK